MTRLPVLAAAPHPRRRRHRGDARHLREADRARGPSRRRRRSSRACSPRSRVVGIVPAAGRRTRGDERIRAGRHVRDVGGAPDPARDGRDGPARRRLAQEGRHEPLRVPRARALLGARHGRDGDERPPRLDLPRARDHVSRSLRALRARARALRRGRGRRQVLPGGIARLGPLPDGDRAALRRDGEARRPVRRRPRSARAASRRRGSCSCSRASRSSSRSFRSTSGPGRLRGRADAGHGLHVDGGQDRRLHGASSGWS